MMVGVAAKHRLPDAPEVTGTSFAESFAGADPDADAERLASLRKMKVVALGFLLGATVIFLLSRWWQAEGGPSWLGYVGAAAEAGMVGALADWFAVTALFRHPLGLKIPHTAIFWPTGSPSLRCSVIRWA